MLILENVNVNLVLLHCQQMLHLVYSIAYHVIRILPYTIHRLAIARVNSVMALFRK